MAYSVRSDIAIIGGGTARVGDQSGKDKTRTMLDDETILD